LQEQANQTSKALGLRIMRILRETIVTNESKFFLLLERLVPIHKWFRPTYRQAGLNLSQLAHLLSQTGISVNLCHEKREV